MDQKNDLLLKGLIDSEVDFVLVGGVTSSP